MSLFLLVSVSFISGIKKGIIKKGMISFFHQKINGKNILVNNNNKQVNDRLANCVVLNEQNWLQIYIYTQMFLQLEQWNDESIVMEATLLVQSQISIYEGHDKEK